MPPFSLEPSSIWVPIVIAGDTLAILGIFGLIIWGSDREAKRLAAMTPEERVDDWDRSIW